MQGSEHLPPKPRGDFAEIGEASMKLGLITACYVYELSGYDGSTPWGIAEGRFRESWSPEKLDDLLRRIKALGFDYVELWRATTGFEEWTEEQVAVVRESLDRHEVSLAAYCVGGIAPDSDVEGLYAYANKLGAPMCTGSLSNQQTEALAVKLAKAGDKYGLTYGIENHGREHTVSLPEDVLALAQQYPGRIGACPDTGLFFDDGVDALAAIEALQGVTVHTHLKDVDDTGSCALGEGKVPLAEIMGALKGAGYSGVYSVEREGDGDPAPLLARSREFLARALSD